MERNLREMSENLEQVSLLQACRKELLAGCIPCQFDLAQSDALSSFSVAPVHVLLGRMSFMSIAIVSKRVEAHFRSMAVDFESEIWFECEKKTLKR
jgi:hypothetical protein